MYFKIIKKRFTRRCLSICERLQEKLAALTYFPSQSFLGLSEIKKGV